MKIKIEISGISPLLMNRFTEENEVKVSSGISAVSNAGKGTPREEATKKAYIDKKGYLYIPAQNIYAAIIAAGKFHKAGKNKITTTKSSLVPAGIFIEDVICPLGTKEFEVDSRSVVIPATGGRIMAYRPRLDEWKTSFTLDVDRSMFDEKITRLLVDDAGSKCGLCDFRPAKRGPFGRFKVTGWKVEK